MDNAKRIREEIDIDFLVNRLKGQDGGLRVSKPDTDEDNGLVQYIWRNARFHSGADTKIPVTSHMWLQDWLDEQGYDFSVTGIIEEQDKEVLRVLDSVTEEVLEELGEDTHGAARDWSGKI